MINTKAHNILMISPFFPAHGGGIEVVAGQLVKILAERGINVQWMAGGKDNEIPTNNYPDNLIIEQATSIDFIEKKLGLPLPIWSFSSIKSLWHRIKTVDIIHLHDYLYMPSLLTLLFAWWLKKPVLITQHIGFIEFKSLFARTLLSCLNHTLGRFILGNVKQVVFVGKPVKDYFSGFVNFKNPPQLIENGVDHSQYQPRFNSENLDNNQSLKFLFVGRFVEKKGIHLLEHCMDIPNIEWNFIGKGPLSPENWVNKKNNQTVLGHLLPEECIEYFRNADLLVLPSIGEGFPLVIQEALACGTPVLISTEVAEVFKEIDSRCVFTAEINEDAAENLKQQLIYLSENKDILYSARKSAWELSQQWSWEQCVDNYFNLYKLINKNK